MNFEWDPLKALSNLAKHGISFVEACHVFDDPFALLADDETHSTQTELRQWIIGECEKGVLVVVFTIRKPGLSYRLISARPAGNREKMLYEKLKTIPI